MAQDWLKIVEDCHEKPEVLRMSAAMGERPEHIVGYCVRFWGWVSRNMSPEDRDKCPGGSVTGVPLVSVEAVLGLPGFLGQLVEVGWLDVSETPDGLVVLTVPNFDRHLSKSSKRRAIEAEKKRKQRAKDPPAGSDSPDSRPGPVPQPSGQSRDNIGTREEKRREEYLDIDRERLPPGTVLDGEWDNPAFRGCLESWVEHLRSHGKIVSAVSIDALLMDFGRTEKSPQECIEAIRYSLRNSWATIHFPPAEMPEGTLTGKGKSLSQLLDEQEKANA